MAIMYLKLIEDRKDYLHNILQKNYYRLFGYFPDWSFSGDWCNDPMLSHYYTRLDSDLKVIPPPPLQK